MDEQELKHYHAALKRFFSRLIIKEDKEVRLDCMNPKDMKEELMFYRTVRSELGWALSTLNDNPQQAWTIFLAMAEALHCPDSIVACKLMLEISSTPERIKEWKDFCQNLPPCVLEAKEQGILDRLQISPIG